MAADAPEDPGRIVTFYSYKGGTGRSMALANVAYLLSTTRQLARHVLAIDWDLEAPGLHRYLEALFSDEERPGLIDLFAALVRRIPRDIPESLDSQEKLAEEIVAGIDLEPYVYTTADGGLDFMPAGKFDATYAARVTSLDWAGLHQRLPTAAGAFARRLADEYSYVLIDSRTGISDTSGICTMLMPELLVAVFTPNRQSLDGLLDIVRRAAKFRLQSSDVRPLTVFPLPSRIDPARPALVAQSRYGEPDGMRGYQPEFEELLRGVYDLSECDLTAYFDEIQVQHVPDYAYGERLAALVEGTSERLSLRRSYESFTRWLVSGAAPWLRPETVEGAARILSRSAAATSALTNGRLDEARKLLAASLEEPEAARAHAASQLADAFAALGSALEAESQLAEAEDAYGQAVTIAIEGAGLGELVVAEYQERRADVLNALGRPVQAVAALRDVTARREAALGRAHESVAEACEKLGTALVAQGHPWEAAEKLRDGLEIRRRALGPAHPTIAGTFERLAEAMANIGDLTSSEDYLRQALELIPSDQPGERVRLLNSLGALHLGARSLTVAERRFEEALELASPADAGAPALVDAVEGAGRVAIELARFDAAADRLEQAQALAEQVLGPQHPATLRIVLDFGDLARARGDFARAGRQYSRIASRFEKDAGAQLAAEAFERLGDVALTRGTYDEAKTWFERALNAFADLRNPGGQAAAYARLGTLETARGDYTAARGYYNNAIAAHEAISNQAGMVETYVQLGNLCRASHAYDEAEIWYGRALETSKKLGRQSGVASAWFEQGQLSLERGSYDQARRRFRRALTIGERLGDPQRALPSRSGVAVALRAMGHLQEALTIQEELLATVENTYGPRHPYALDATRELAETLRATGDLARAQALQERAVAVLRETLGDRHPDTVRADADLAQLQQPPAEPAGHPAREPAPRGAPKAAPAPRRGGRQRTKVAVLGGGVGALAAAFELTAPELAGRYDVTVYQPGWRLGGKCASGRGGSHARIEEHGLHVWFGFYANAFSLMQRCYAEWNPPRTSPFRSWRDAFKKCNDIVLFEQWKGEWKPWHLYLEADDQVPGTRDEVPPSEFLRRLLEFLLDQWGLVREQHGAAIPDDAPAPAPRLPVIGGVLHAVSERVEKLERAAGSNLLVLAHAVARAWAADPGAQGHAGHVATLLSKFKRWLFDDVLESLIDDEVARRYAIMLDFWATTVCGMVADGVFERGFGVINDVDLRVWLERHGAEALTLEHAAFLSGLYDLVFGYVEGNKRRPDLAAGKALQAMIRIVLEYKGAVLWKMQAGMGDTVLTPLYDVLRRRGVRFRFFHQVTKLCVSSDRESVERIEIQPQARVKRGRYDPIVTVGGLRCWPSEPRWGELVGGEELAARGVNFEQGLGPVGLKPMVLEAGEDFDEVVLGIPVGALPPLCEELAAANPRFAAMLEHSDTVMTEGIQLWFSRTAEALGWPFEPAIATSYVARADTYSNMSQLLARETWTGAGPAPADVAYLCGVLLHSGIGSQADADARVRENALGFLRTNAGPLWPRAVGGGGAGFDWDVLAADAGVEGEGRLDAQFLRANFQPTERYVLTRAGSVKYRLGAGESGFSNLKLAGDWTRNGIDGGSVEAAITSGMQAARAISGHPRVIQGEHGWLVDD